jgi:hypothetical protein
MVRRPRNCSWLINNSNFGNLAARDFKCASDPDDDYNCIAWAAGKTDRPWWPTTTAPYFWPPGLPKEPPHVAETLDNFIEAFKRQGYEVCWGGRFSRRYEKVAIYVGNKGKPTHAARMLPSGGWSSKLGDEEDIEHKDVKCIEGKLYGQTKVFLKRPRFPSRKSNALTRFLSYPLRALRKAQSKFSPIPKQRPTGS